MLGKMEEKSKQQQNVIIKKTNQNFKIIIQAANISKMDQPLEYETNDPELDVVNPYSKVTCLCLYLYSMELGSPPLYAELNRVARDMDLS